MYSSFVSQGNFIPKHFILLFAMVRGIDSLISLSDFSFLSNKMSTSRYISREVLCPKENLSRPQPQEILQPQQVGLLQAPFKSLFLPWVPVSKRPSRSVHASNSRVSVYPSPGEFLQANPAGLLSQVLWRLLLLMPDPGWEALLRAQNPHSCWRTSAI